MSNFCVCCGEEIPEGRMVCYSCEKGNANTKKESKKGCCDEKSRRNFKEYLRHL